MLQASCLVQPSWLMPSRSCDRRMTFVIPRIAIICAFSVQRSQSQRPLQLFPIHLCFPRSQQQSRLCSQSVTGSKRIPLRGTNQIGVSRRLNRGARRHRISMLDMTNCVFGLYWGSISCQLPKRDGPFASSSLTSAKSTNPVSPCLVRALRPTLHSLLH
jgi:hypothetical protein